MLKLKWEADTCPMEWYEGTQAHLRSRECPGLMKKHGEQGAKVFFPALSFPHGRFQETHCHCLYKHPEVTQLEER